MSRLSELTFLALTAAFLLPWAWACAAPEDGAETTAPAADLKVEPGPDPHSYARPDEAAVRHLDLDVEVDFEQRQINGRASLTLDRQQGVEKLHLDTRGLDIHSVSLDGGEATTFALAAEDPFLGQALVIDLEPGTEVVHVDYSSRRSAQAVQWLEPAQTTDGESPFLFTQSQAILARTWIPLQDSPAVRFTYSAKVQVPEGLMAVMSAENPTEKSADGTYSFTMPQAIPSYLMALAVGDLEFQALGPRSGVYAEPSVVEAAAWELAETEAMIDAAEELYGPYRWGRYDVLFLPASFPFGGMENPRLTFATPTILAGDRSLVALVAHELAHSWSGNLVTNADWNDFWLNEGFTVYFEERIMEAVYGRDYSEMLALLSLQDLQREVETLGAESRDTWLHLDLAGRDPDEGMTSIAYDKGYFFLRRLEEALGRETWDTFLRSYFEVHAFRSMTTEDFLAYLDQEMGERMAALGDPVDLEAWIFAPGIPADLPQPRSAAFDEVDAELQAWLDGRPANQLDTASWSTHEWLHLLRKLPAPLPESRMAELDEAFGLTTSGNAEIQSAWFQKAVASDYQAAYPALEDFLVRVGRRKFLRPLYEALVQTPEGLSRAEAIYEKARPGYHSVSTATIDQLLADARGA